MKYTVIAVGKLKERFWKDACAEYLKRLGGYAKVEVREVADIDPARAGGVDASRNREGASILSSIPDRAHVILLAIEGKERSSEELLPTTRPACVGRQQRHRLYHRWFRRRVGCRAGPRERNALLWPHHHAA